MQYRLSPTEYELDLFKYWGTGILQYHAGTFFIAAILSAELKKNISHILVAKVIEREQ
jgi:hypothetical protein